MFSNILIVCVGNICRSPMAEGLLKHALAKANKQDYHIESAGLSALTGKHPDPSACNLMLKKGIDISNYHACQLNKEMIRKSNLVLVMEANHKTAIEQAEPTSRGKVFRLGEWGEGDITDPYQKGMLSFKHTLSLIEKSVEKWVPKL